MNRSEVIARMKDGASVTQVDAPFNGGLHARFFMLSSAHSQRPVKLVIANKVFEKLINQHKVESGDPIHDSEAKVTKTNWKWKGGVI